MVIHIILLLIRTRGRGNPCARGRNNAHDPVFRRRNAIQIGGGVRVRRASIDSRVVRKKKVQFLDEYYDIILVRF